MSPNKFLKHQNPGLRIRLQTYQTLSPTTQLTSTSEFKQSMIDVLIPQPATPNNIKTHFSQGRKSPGTKIDDNTVCANQLETSIRRYQTHFTQINNLNNYPAHPTPS